MAIIKKLLNEETIKEDACEWVEYYSLTGAQADKFKEQYLEILTRSLARSALGDNRPVEEKQEVARSMSLNMALSVESELKTVRVISKNSVPIKLSLNFAKSHNLTDAVIYEYLRGKQEEAYSYNEAWNVRNGRRWIKFLTAADIATQLNFILTLDNIKDGLERLRLKRLIEVESTGIFLEPELRTGRKRDLSSWYAVNSCKNYENIITLDSSDCLNYDGLNIPLLKWYYNQAPAAKIVGYKKLDAVEMSKVLPICDKTIKKELNKKPFKKLENSRNSYTIL